MRYLILLFGVYCCSTSVIFIKIGTTDPIVLSAYRLLLGGLFLSPALFLARRHLAHHPWPTILKRAAPPAAFLAVHFITWIAGARMTPSANASLIVNMVPAVMPFLLWIILKERVTRAELTGTGFAMLGVFLLGMADFNFSKAYALGDLVCFVSMLLYAFYLIHARKNKDLPSIHLYIIPVYLMAGLLCLFIAALLDLAGRPTVWLGNQTDGEWLSILGLALVPTVFGHSIVNWALSHIRGQAVVLINLSQFIFAGIMGFLFLSEIPQPAFYLASALVVSGALFVVRQRLPQSN